MASVCLRALAMLNALSPLYTNAYIIHVSKPTIVRCSSNSISDGSYSVDGAAICACVQK